jgi:hypothetical protein
VNDLDIGRASGSQVSLQAALRSCKSLRKMPRRDLSLKTLCLSTCAPPIGKSNARRRHSSRTLTNRHIPCRSGVPHLCRAVMSTTQVARQEIGHGTPIVSSAASITAVPIVPTAPTWSDTTPISRSAQSLRSHAARPPAASSATGPQLRQPPPTGLPSLHGPDRLEKPLRRVSELASGLTRNQVPRKGLWVRIPCPPLAQMLQ